MIRATSSHMSEAASVSLSESSQGEETTESGNESTNRNGSVSADSSGANFKEELAGKESRDFVYDQEEKDFRTTFAGFANEVIDAAGNNAQNSFNSISSFSSVVTSFAISTGAKWPNVTVPHFEIRGREAHKLAGFLLLTLTPIVNLHDKDGWEAYSVERQNWIQEGLDYGAELYGETTSYKAQPISSRIYTLNRGGRSPVTHGGPFAPQWQQAPAPRNQAIVNLDLLLNPTIQRTYQFITRANHAILSETVNLRTLYQNFVSDDSAEDPHSFLMQPVYDEFGDGRKLVAFMMAILPWNNYFANLVAEDVQGIFLVMRSSCGSAFTYLINGRTASFLGMGDVHDMKFNSLKHTQSFTSFLYQTHGNFTALCTYDMDIYPSSTLYEESKTHRPFTYALAVASCFLVTTAVFLLYDWAVFRRQQKVMATALRTNRIVSSLFPSTVRDRIMKEAEQHVLSDERSGKLGPAPKTMLRTFLNSEQQNHDGSTMKNSKHVYGSQPIADLFPETTILFADIVGFTAWSSMREPEQVFTLLETIYHSFDRIAARRRVFKVETVGDCYVAATGLPSPQKEHALIMAKFAHDCLLKMKDVCRDLETTLGPETGDLGMRFGIHSGPVTAGVLRGERARFQLFGDTMNTASRIESTGKMDKIHVSKDTADLLIAAGKSAWVVPREDKIVAKGKGEMESFWLDMNASESRSSCTKSSADDSDDDIHDNHPTAQSSPMKPILELVTSEKIQRLVSWNVDVLSGLLRNIVARRMVVGRSPTEVDIFHAIAHICSAPLDEAKEIVTLPKFDPEVTKREDPNTIELDRTVCKQLKDYVTAIASMYRDNPFHNFEHASHVTMSVKKLLARIVRPDAIDGAKDLHDHTYGITSDPLTQFTVVFSALVHDVDHSGVPNVIAIQENVDLAAAYKCKSVAEQNSVDLAWSLLMSPNYKELRESICATKEEAKRFRQLVVNTVLATDIMDKELALTRKNRWEKAFSGVDELADSNEDKVNRKATIVIEHLIQASDVAHTMQHWHIYKRWNEALFHEMYRAFKVGRTVTNPAETWYEGEIAFFDFYIIPLAKKLNTCGVFGVSCYEYLGYAEKNREEWKSKGIELVREYVENYEMRTASIVSTK